jgi:hypothetical protein
MASKTITDMVIKKVTSLGVETRSLATWANTLLTEVPQTTQMPSSYYETRDVTVKKVEN